MTTLIKRYSLYLILLIVLLAGVGFLAFSNGEIDSQEQEAKDALLPAEISITMITADDCSECVSASKLSELVELENVKILKSDEYSYDSEEGRSVIEEYGINRVPTIIVKGEVDKKIVSSFFEKYTTKIGDAMSWNVNQPVYIDVKTGEAIGRVELTLITDESCKECAPPTVLQNILTGSFGVNIVNTTSVDRKSAEGRNLIAKYNIEFVPTVIASKESNAYLPLTSAWQQVGSIEEDGVYIFRNMQALGGAVYRDLTAGEIIKPTQK